MPNVYVCTIPQIGSRPCTYTMQHKKAIHQYFIPDFLPRLSRCLLSRRHDKMDINMRCDQEYSPIVRNATIYFVNATT
ncbi:hypothetical protein DID88_005759 [Monilinia fructigena]|uniref:Uncharacterized protein n=1 Tax=Monilinia fructigena TaxID=38457 RepID=A0A395J167_9HELO|nr:hypothetical protein DID88_005759 [Monilinia fructigena]